MPIYEYQCRECGEEIEVLQKISDPPLTECPACGKSALKKKVSAAAFRLKGGGWYETDFKTGNKKNLVGGGDRSEGASAEGGKSGDGGGKEGGAKESTGGKEGGKKETPGSKNGATTGGKQGKSEGKKAG